MLEAFWSEGLILVALGRQTTPHKCWVLGMGKSAVELVKFAAVILAGSRAGAQGDHLRWGSPLAQKVMARGSCFQKSWNRCSRQRAKGMQGSQGGRSRLWPGEGKNRKRSVGLEAHVLRERVEYDFGKTGKSFVRSLELTGVCSDAIQLFSPLDYSHQHKTNILFLICIYKKRTQTPWGLVSLHVYCCISLLPFIAELIKIYTHCLRFLSSQPFFS